MEKFKKAFVLIVLFVLPMVTYLFFASGVNNFAKLPVLTKGINSLSGFKSDSGEELSFKNKITVLGFFGGDIEHKKSNAFNLNQKIYNHFYEFNDFQFVIVVPNGTSAKVKTLKAELAEFADVKNWKFAYGSDERINTLFNSLQTNLALDSMLSTTAVFIIDKEENLRGRKKDDNEEVLYGFDATSAASLHNKMKDDVKILLAEYRLALKKNNKYKENSDEQR